jgi:hypothetical protein
LDAAGKVRGDASAQRAAEENDLSGGHTLDLSQPLVGGLGVEVSARLGRSAGTVAVPAIVEDEAAQPQLAELIETVQAVHDVAAVAVAVQKGESSVLGRHVPAAQHDPVAALKHNFLEIQAQVGGGERHVANGPVEQPRLQEQQRQAPRRIDEDQDAGKIQQH